MDWKQQRDKYVAERILGQVGWYNRKSTINKNGYYLCRYLTIFSGALIPLLVGYSEGDWAYLKYFAGLLGVVVVIAEGILSLKKYRENWSTYRLTAERLQRELFFFENQVGEDYASGTEDAFKRFVARAEQLMASENEEWKSYLEAQQGDKPE